MVGQMLWQRDRKQKKFLVEGSDDVVRARLEEKEQGAAQHFEEADVPVTIGNEPGNRAVSK